MLDGQLKQWFAEFRTLTECPDVPDALWAFMVRRLQESGVIADDPNIVRMVDGRRVKVTGTRRHAELFLVVWESQGRQGWSQVADFHPDDNAKLANIVDRFEGAA